VNPAPSSQSQEPLHNQRYLQSTSVIAQRLRTPTRPKYNQL